MCSTECCFADTWSERWQPSTWKSEEGQAGKFEHTAGDWYGHPEADKGIKTTPDARFYTIWTEMEEEVVNKGKDLVLQVCSWCISSAARIFPSSQF